MNGFEVLFLCILCIAAGINIGLSDWFPRLMRVRLFRMSDWVRFFGGR